MSHRTKRVLISTPIWMTLEFFLLKYIFLLYGGINDLYIFIITIVLGLMQTMPMLFEEKKSRLITRFFTRIFGIWEWFVVMLLITTLAIYILGVFIDIPINLINLVFLIIILIGVYAYYNAHHIIKKEHILEIDNLKEDINIVHISDIHFGSVRHKKLLRNLKDKLNEIDDADIIIISGDIADGSSIIEEDDFMILSEVKTPIVFTSGNHDYYPGVDNVHKALNKAGVYILENSKLEYKNLNIYGLSYSFGDIKYPTKEELKNSISDDLVNILIFHVPYYWEEFSKLGFDIQLSGHTHGGQFYPIKWFGNLVFNHYNLGLFKQTLNGRNKYLNVTPGVGSMDIPMRWGTHSEIDILKLRRK